MEIIEKSSKSVGVVIFRRIGRSYSYLLLHHGGSYWNFPKGTQEQGEADLQTALRELEEETGIKNVKLIDEFVDQYQYEFDSEIRDGVRERIYKTAIFYLGEVENDEVKISGEHIDYGWFDYETALKRLFFQNGQDVLKRAHKHLLSQQDFVL
jgi:8-oxo-dGTP pyrophosphatase MutT (NUDIX family)